eukprot:gene41380-55972_t
MSSTSRAPLARAKVFGFRLAAYDPFVDDATFAAAGVRKLDAAALLREAGILSLHLPLTDQTKYFLNRESLATMRKDAVIVNTARGDIVQKAAVFAALRRGHLAGAGLDVYEHEPALNAKLLKLAARNKVVLLPHMGSATLEGRIDMGEKVIINIRAFISPFRRERELARDLIGADRFSEVFVDTPLSVCEARDPKGLYKKARGGFLQNMTGIDSAYERPQTPDVIVNGSTSTVQESVDAVCLFLRGVVHPVAKTLSCANRDVAS